MESAFQIIGVLVGVSLFLLLTWAFVNYAEDKGYGMLPSLLLVLLTGGVGVVIVWLLHERVGSPAYRRRVVGMANAVPRSRLYRARKVAMAARSR